MIKCFSCRAAADGMAFMEKPDFYDRPYCGRCVDKTFSIQKRRYVTFSEMREIARRHSLAKSVPWRDGAGEPV